MTDRKSRIERLYALDEKRTQGSWEVDCEKIENSKGYTEKRLVGIRENDGTPVIWFEDGGYDCENADVYLAASAPEMLAIIREQEAEIAHKDKLLAMAVEALKAARFELPYVFGKYQCLYGDKQIPALQVVDETLAALSGGKEQGRDQG